MRVKLSVIAGPHEGTTFAFDHHDTFLVGRSRHAHFQLAAKDRFFSRIHFMLEVNPPHCRLIDMGSHNGTFVNGQRVLTADLHDGDQIRAGHTVLRLEVLSRETSEPAAAVPSRPAAPPATPPGALPSIPGYQVRRELTRGAVGAVYEAARAGEEAPVAIRLIRPAHEPTPAQGDDFLRAGRFLHKIAHPHLARVCDLGALPGQFYFVFEHAPGTSAEAVVQRDGPLGVIRAIRWTNQVLQALKYAHGLHFVHGDIKPANLVVGEADGKEAVKVTEFGVARLYQAAPFSGLSITSDLLAAAFQPPELLLDYRNPQPAADQYAVAATLYYLLTGRHVVDLPGEVHERLSTLLRSQPVPIRERRPELSAALAHVIHKALARSPAQRYANVEAFRAALIHAVQTD
jgi:serine/threonine-protein kinase